MTTTTPGFDGTEHAKTGPASAEWLVGPAAPGPTPPPDKPWHKRTWVRVTGLLVAAPIAIGIIASAVGGSHPATATPAPPASSAPASPAKPAQPATASGYLTAHGYTPSQHWSRSAWLHMTQGTGHDGVNPYIANGPDVAAYGTKPDGAGILVLKLISGVTKISGVTGSHFDAPYLVIPGGSPAPPAPAPATTAPAAPTTVPTPATTAPAAPVTQAPAGPTVSQQQALDAAQSYLQMGSGFSRAGLIAQLDSPNGNQFSVADATWAADHSGADWNAQAVMAAQGYMKLGGFSRSSLIDQLDSPYGGQFTYAQATYAANQVGL
jgi:Host cell surface-exposed lipoprotein